MRLMTNINIWEYVVTFFIDKFDNHIFQWFNNLFFSYLNPRKKVSVLMHNIYLCISLNQYNITYGI